MKTVWVSQRHSFPLKKTWSVTTIVAAIVARKSSSFYHLDSTNVAAKITTSTTNLIMKLHPS